MHRVYCSVRGQRPKGAWGELSDCITDSSFLCSATASLPLLWARRSDAYTLQVNKECHWQQERMRSVCGEREVKSGGKSKSDIRGGWKLRKGIRTEIEARGQL